VEVALVDSMADGITPLLDEAAAAGADLAKATTAIFYSISNTQNGLRGVSFGDSLIKRVVETLQGRIARSRPSPRCRRFPGFATWLAKNAPARLLATRSGGRDRPPWARPPTANACSRPGEPSSEVAAALAAGPRRYLGRALVDGKPADPVARFHLGNGARVERLNWAGDPSPKGHKQSYGLMVNYLYDLKRLDKHRTAGWTQGL
jgi:malonyl-CoA decarboxylase